MTHQRWKFKTEYDGGPYTGWQRQEERLPTIQASIEKAIFGYCQEHVTAQGAGRTDAGVHAKGQIFHADLPIRDITGFELCKALTAHLMPEPIVVIAAEKVSNEFHARFDSKNKLYEYKIIRRSAPLTYDRGKAWHIKRELNVDAMVQASKYLLGHHDFSTFRDSNCQAKSAIKTVDRIDITERDYDGCGGTEITFQVEGKSFLHHQVRNMVGTLSLVGDGKWQIDDVKTALEACDRTQGGTNAPADGLYLIRVDY